MKCEIIRDLLPSYVDGLTSGESDRAIEEHLRDCGDCKGVSGGDETGSAEAGDDPGKQESDQAL